MTQEMLCTGATQDVVALIKQCAFPADAFLLVEKLPRQVVRDEERQDLLRFARLGDGVDVAQYTSGRIFNKTFELRWEQEAGATKVVYLGEERELPGLQWQKATFEPIGTPKHYYLYGQRLDARDLAAMGIARGREDYSYYAEVRIPRLLHYPFADQARRVQLVVGEYRSPAMGQMFRFQDVRSAEEDGGQA